ncbi:MAG: DUF3179 domain-containing protein [Chloroflexi bacterium]|nr:DUF3179 domain-containing protein [Chloroflexota bacterium]
MDQLKLYLLISVAAGVLLLAGCFWRGGTPRVIPQHTPTSESLTEREKDWADRVLPLGNWRTDISRRTVPLWEVQYLGLRRNAIPPLYPNMVKLESVGEADVSLDPMEPVQVFEHRGDARAYPLRILIWHEVVNDTVGELPVAVTY